MESTDRTFSEDIRAAGPVAAVLFLAEWARRCHEIHEFTEAVARRTGLVDFLTVNTDRNPLTTHACGIHRVPTIAIVNPSGVVWRSEDLLDVDAFVAAWSSVDRVMLGAGI